MSNFFSVSGWLFGLISIFVAIYTYYKTRVIKKLEGNFQSFVVLNPSVDWSNNISIKIRDQPELYKELHLTQITIRNKGNVTFYKKEFRSPLKIRLSPDVHIKSTWHRSDTKQHNETVMLSADQGQVSIIWDYLDPSESVTVNVFTDQKISDVNYESFFDSNANISKHDGELRKSFPLIANFVIMVAMVIYMWLGGFNAKGDRIFAISGVSISTLHLITFVLVMFGVFMLWRIVGKKVAPRISRFLRENL